MYVNNENCVAFGVGYFYLCSVLSFMLLGRKWKMWDYLSIGQDFKFALWQVCLMKVFCVCINSRGDELCVTYFSCQFWE